MFLQSFDKIMSIIVFLCAPIVSPITAFMFYMGTGNFKNLNTIWKRDDNNDIHNVMSWSFHFISAVIFYFLNAPILNFLYQIFLGTVIRHAIWMLHNYHKKRDNPHLFVPFWKLTPSDMWKNVCVSIIPMMIAIYMV